MAIKEIKRYNNGLNEMLSEFICDSITDLEDMPKLEDGITAGSTTQCLENKTKYMLSLDDEWKIFKEPKATEELVAQTAQNILNTPLKNITWNAFAFIPFFFDEEGISFQGFSRLVNRIYFFTYKAFHYSFDIAFEWYAEHGTDGGFNLQDPNTGDIIHTFQLVDGINTLSLEWHDVEPHIANKSIILKLSLNGGETKVMESIASDTGIVYPGIVYPIIGVLDIGGDFRWCEATNLILY